MSFADGRVKRRPYFTPKNTFLDINSLTHTHTSPLRFLCFSKPFITVAPEKWTPSRVVSVQYSTVCERKKHANLHRFFSLLSFFEKCNNGSICINTNARDAQTCFLTYFSGIVCVMTLFAYHFRATQPTY